jgi:hypothetical protein
MKRQLLCIALALLGASNISFAAESPEVNLTQALAEVEKYVFGESRKSLIVVEEAALAAVGNPQASNTIEKAMLSVLAAEGATADAKRFACRTLGLIGSRVSIEPLGALLEKPEYFGQALQALESLATLDIDLVDGVLSRYAFSLGADQQVAILSCMGRYKSKVLAVMGAKFLASDSPAVREAMASALGKTAAPDTCAALAKHFVETTAPRGPLYDGCLACAPLLAADPAEAARALDWFKLLLAPETPAAIRGQAYVRIAALPAYEDATLEAARAALLATADADSDVELVRARVSVLEHRADGVTGLVALLDNADPQVQVYALAALARRKDASAVPAIAAKLGAESAEVRASALRALAVSASDEAFDPLFALVTGADKDLQRGATDALSMLNAPGVNARLADTAQNGSPELKVIALNLLAARRATDMHDVIRAAADSADAPVFEAAHGALQVVAVEADLPGLLDKALDTSDEARAKTYQSTAVALASRLAEDKQVALLGDRLKSAKDAAQRGLILSLVGRVGGKPAFELLSGQAASPEQETRTAVAKALAQWTSQEALTPLANILKTEPKSEAGKAAFNGVVRLMREAKVSSATGMEYVQALRRAAESDSDRRQLLQVISRVTDLRAFRIAESLLKTEALAVEAEQTLVDLGKRLAGAYPKHVQARMLQIARTSKKDNIKQAATDVSNAINSFGDFLTSWAVSGPYLVEGKRANEIYDVAFPPESTLHHDDKDGEGHKGWEICPAGMTPGKPGYVDLQEEFMDNECVAYLRTSFTVDVLQVGRLQVGSDDGCKIWVNGELKSSSVGMRHYVPDEDVCQMELQPGTHTIVIAVYEHASDWGFSARLSDPQGTPLLTLKQLPPMAAGE